jgi:hypothetical protein
MVLKRLKDFKMFEEEQKPSYFNEPGGLLGKKPSAKEYHKIVIHRGGETGSGVLCCDYIQDGEVIEEVPYIELGAEAVKVDSLNDYLFRIGDDKYALALGCGSLYNHKNQPNVSYEIDETKKSIIFTALRDIQPSEELFISYGKNYWKSRGVKPKDLEK